MKKKSEQFIVSQTGRDEFSLSELLVVTSILGALCSLLFPAPQHVGDRIPWVRCVNPGAEGDADFPGTEPAGCFGAISASSRDEFIHAEKIPLPAADGSASRRLWQPVPAMATGVRHPNDQACTASPGIRVMIGETECTLMVSDAVIRCGCGY